MRNSRMYRRLYYTRRRKGFGLRSVFIIILTLIILFLAATYTQKKVFPYIMDVSEIKTRKIVTEVVESSIQEEFNDAIVYDDVVFVLKDNYKRITSIQTNVNRLNTLSSIISANIQERLLSEREERVGIPLGAFLGSTLFSAEGPDIYVKFIPAGKVEINYKSELADTGPNQLKHSISLEVKVILGTSLPLIENEREIIVYVPLVENVIVGNMPTILGKKQ